MDLSVLKNSGLWSAIVASLALILSQLPPLRELIKGRKLKIVVPEILMLSHTLGNIEINLSIEIHNAGGRFLSISKLELVIIDTENNIWQLPARTYYSRQPPQPGMGLQEFLLGSISLKSGEHWNETVHCYRLWSETEEEKVNDIRSKISKDILNKRQSLPPNAPNVEVDDVELVKEAINFYEKLFNLHKGNYQLIIAGLSEDNSILSVRGFEFTLFESNINALRNHIEEYKYGGGIYYPISGLGKIVLVRLKPVSDNKKIHEIYEKIHSR